MRHAPPVLLVLLLLASTATATHAPARDVQGEVENGAGIHLALRAVGGVESHGSGREVHGMTETSTTHSYRLQYSWGGTVQLDLRADGKLDGDAFLTGGGTARLADHAHRTIRDYEGEVINELDSYRDCDARVEMFNEGRLYARGVVDRATGELVVLLRSLAQSTADRPCTFRSEGGSEQSDLFPRPPLSPLLVEGIARVSTDEELRRIDPSLDELNAASALVFRVPLEAGHSIVRGGASAPLPATYGATPLGYACPPALEARIVEGTCSAAGTLDVRVLVDPCPTLRESRDVHLAAVKAIARPPDGSSEAQVRAFTVDAREKIRTLLADERALQLICGDESTDAFVALSEATAKILAAWVDVAKNHGLSDQGKRELLGAARNNELMGGEPSVEAAAVVGEALGAPGDHGRIDVQVHSPVALHAWDEAGRHVGWNESTNAADAQIDGANYTGAPGGPQTLSLPSGFYKIAVVELGAGAYLLDTAWNGTGGSGVELLPAASEAGRTLVFNALLDEHGLLAGPAQRVATRSSGPHEFVEAWNPMDAGPSAAAGGARAPRDAKSGAETPAASPALALSAAVAAAILLAARRR